MRAFFLGLLTLSLWSFSSAVSEEGATKTLPLKNPELSVFAELMVDAGIADLFKGTGPFTGFIPTNAAFEKLGNQKLRELKRPQKKDQLAEMLMYHIVPGKYLARNLKTDRLKTVNGKYLQITVQDGQIKVNGAKIIQTDIVGPNGVIQEIDTILLPSQ